jgi:hypothetical protein
MSCKVNLLCASGSRDGERSLRGLNQSPREQRNLKIQTSLPALQRMSIARHVWFNQAVLLFAKCIAIVTNILEKFTWTNAKEECHTGHNDAKEEPKKTQRRPKEDPKKSREVENPQTNTHKKLTRASPVPSPIYLIKLICSRGTNGPYYISDYISEILPSYGTGTHRMSMYWIRMPYRTLYSLLLPVA